VRLTAEVPRVREILDRFDRQVRCQPQGGGVERAEGVVRLLGDGWRGVTWSGLGGLDADAVIAREVERFAGLGPWEWKLYAHDVPTDLGERLAAAGLARGAEEALLLGEIGALQLPGTLPTGVELRDVSDEHGVAVFMAVHAAAFGEPPDDGRWLLDEVLAGRQAAVIAVAGDLPICAGRVEFYPGSDFAGLFGGGTLPGWRGRGVFRAVVARRAVIAAERGYRWLQVDAMPASRPILESMGFELLGTTTPFTHA